MPRPEPPGGELESLLVVERRLDAALADARRRAEGVLRTAEEQEREADERFEEELAERIGSRRAAHAARLEAGRRRLDEQAACLVAALERLDAGQAARLVDRLLDVLLPAPEEGAP